MQNSLLCPHKHCYRRSACFLLTENGAGSHWAFAHAEERRTNAGVVFYGVVNRYFDTQTPQERTMHTARPFALLMAMVLVLLTACSAPSARQTPFPPDTRVVVAFISHDGTGGLE